MPSGRLRDWANPIRQLPSTLVEAIREWLGRHNRAAQILRYLGAGVLCPIALLALIGVNKWLADGGLWGDLAFSLVITTGVLWALFHAAVRVLPQKLEFSPLGCALAATTLLLIGIPVATVTWPFGAALIFLCFFALVVAHLFWRTQVQLRLWWISVLCGVGAALLVVSLSPPLKSVGRLPGAVPVAAVGEDNAELAKTFRPFLFLDTAEKRYPLDIEDAFANDRIRMCFRGVSGDDCPAVTTPSDLDNAAAYLEVGDAPPPLRGGDASSAYYYHVTSHEDTGGFVVDYWWFYARNPSPVAGDIFCGPGFRFPPFTCQAHAGDWEGLSLMVAPCATRTTKCVETGGRLLTPTTVRYAQHEGVKPYSWEYLEKQWSALTLPSSRALQPAWKQFVLPAAAEHGLRPLVFVARDSHASYPFACLGSCQQTGRRLPEGRHDGGLPWVFNLSCLSCVKPLPLTNSGQPASWNAFAGRWGAQNCILGGAYCDLSPAPRSPSEQTRYQDPSGTD